MCDKAANASGEHRNGPAAALGHQLIVSAPQYRGGGNQRDDGQKSLDEHAPIGNGLGIRLFVQLLGRRARGDQRVKSRNRPASHRHKENGKEHPLALDAERGKSGRLHLGAGGEDPRHARDEDHIQQKGAQVVSRLQEHPDRRDGGEEDVHKQYDLPRIAGECRVARQHQWKTQSQGNAPGQQRHADDGGQPQRGIEAVHTHAKNDGHHNEQERGRRRGGLFHKHIGHGMGKHGDHQCDQRPRKGQKQTLARGAHVLFNDFSDGLAAVPHGGHERREVVDPSQENTPDDDPHQDRDPPEHGRDDRSNDRSGAGDRGEVVPQQHRGLRWHIIDTVSLRMGGRFAMGVQTIPT